MKKALIIIPIVIVIAAATVLGLFAAGIIGGKKDAPVAYAVDGEAAETTVFKELSTDTFFDVLCDRDPSTSLGNYIVVYDNKGNKVPLKCDRQGNGVYRISARDGFKPRASYLVKSGVPFVAEQYKDLNSFIFMTKGEAEVEKVVVNEGIQTTALAETTVVPYEQNGKTYYKITLASPAEARYATGDVILSKKPAKDLFDDDLDLLYTGDIEGYAYNGMAAYVLLNDSEVVDGKEVLFCRLADVNEVVSEIDVYKTLTLDEANFSVNEALLQKALDESEFTAAVYEAAVEAFDLFSGKFEKTVKESPKMVAKFEYSVDTDKIQLDFYFTITLAKGMDVVFAVKNTINITPNVNCDYEMVGVTDFDLQLDLGVNIKTKTVCSIDMETSDAKLQAKDMEDFKKKFKDLVEGKTTEKAIVGTELPIYSYKYPIYCFVLGIEFGVDLNLGLKAQINFEYVYITDITAGVTYVNGEIDSYKSIETSSTAKDLVMLGKIRAEAGVYVKLTASLLEVAGVGFKVKTGAYAEIAGQLRLDMKAAMEDKTLHIIKGYYVTGGLYLALGFEVKAGITIPGIGWKGWEKYWEPARWDFPLFEYGSKYLVQSLVNKETNIEIYGKTAEIGTIKVNAFDLEKIADANQIDVGLDAFDFEYLDGAENYITITDGVVKVNPTVGTEFTAEVLITAKSDNYVKGKLVFHKAAVMPTCEVTELTFDKHDPEDVTFDVKKNQSLFITLNGNGITEQSRYVADGGAVTIFKDYLAGLDVGEHTFVYVTDKGRVTLTVNVIDKTPISAPVTQKKFSKGAPANVVFTLVLAGNKVTEIQGLEKGDYSVNSKGTLVIFSAVFEDKAVGSYDYKVVSTNESELDLTVTVEDDRLPALYEKSYVFAKNAGVKNDVTVTFESYCYDVIGVEGHGITADDQVVDKNSVRIGKDFLAKLDRGTYDFKVKFNGATGNEYRAFSVKILDNAVIIAGSSVATFDKNKPADVQYSVFASAAVSLTGKGKNIGSSDYTVSGSVVTISKAYLAGLEVGEYTFVARAGSSTVDLALTVIDTTAPEIESAQGGVLTIEYDKAQSGDRFFEIMLGSATFEELDGYGVVSGGQYVVSKNESKGTTKVTLREAYLNSLRSGTYQYNVITSVNVSTLIVKISDSRKPESGSETGISYRIGSGKDVVVQFNNYEHDVKAISVVNGNDFSLFEDADFDAATGTLTLRKAYLSGLQENSYVTLMLTFDDAAETVLSITLAIIA